MLKLAGSPHRKRMALYAAGGGVGVIVAAFLLIYFVIFPTSSPSPFKLSATTTSATSTSANATSANATSGNASSRSATYAGSATGSLAGTWKIAGGSQAGYRVREKLAFLPARSDAVGRTSQITGSATFTDRAGALTVSSASFDVNVLTLKSDRSMRDEKIKEIGLESSRYPTATFVLSSPATIPAGILKGEVVHTRITGVLEIHGVSKRETLPVEMSVSGSTVQAVGSLTFPWSEFGMTAPSIGGFVNVTEHATMEFDLRLARS
jgi:polyisoprenoid-binding protein YceI